MEDNIKPLNTDTQIIEETEFYEGTPNRKEVENYVEQSIARALDSADLVVSVLIDVLVAKGLTTQEELTVLTEEKLARVTQSKTSNK